ncbi:MAG: DUF4070 domain-containing protein, partial [Nitrospirales bacterium]|nr:DUF4070 domain-containing protein [Nitrospirales bacterium]
VVDFLVRNKVELAYFNVLTPLPGTALFDRFNREGRILDRDWAKYDGKHVVFKPNRMTPEQLQEGFFWANHQLYSWPSIWGRIGHTSQRFIPRLEMNWQFRRLIRRSTPQGSISPLAKVLKNLQAKLPTFETGHLIPNALIGNPGLPTKPQDLCLKVKARRHDAFAALIIELEGTLDHLNAKELLERIKQAAREAKMDIVVNFEHLKQATPKAIQTLLDGKKVQAITPYAKLRYRKLKEAFQAAVQDMSSGDLDLFDEASHHA